METKRERRLRKLKALCEEKGGYAAVAAEANVNEAALDQILKGVLLPPRTDGTRNPRTLGDSSARAIEAAYNLGVGWFDSDDAEVEWHPHIRRLAEGLSKITDADARDSILLGAQAQVDRQLERQRLADDSRSGTNQKRGSSR